MKLYGSLFAISLLTACSYERPEPKDILSQLPIPNETHLDPGVYWGTAGDDIWHADAEGISHYDGSQWNKVVDSLPPDWPRVQFVSSFVSAGKGATWVQERKRIGRLDTSGHFEVVADFSEPGLISSVVGRNGDGLVSYQVEPTNGIDWATKGYAMTEDGLRAIVSPSLDEHVQNWSFAFAADSTRAWAVAHSNMSPAHFVRYDDGQWSSPIDIVNNAYDIVYKGFDDVWSVEYTNTRYNAAKVTRFTEGGWAEQGSFDATAAIDDSSFLNMLGVSDVAGPGIVYLYVTQTKGKDSYTVSLDLRGIRFDGEQGPPMHLYRLEPECNWAGVDTLGMGDCIDTYYGVRSTTLDDGSILINYLTRISNTRRLLIGRAGTL